MKLLGSGVRQTISFKHIANSELSLPPLHEQEAIASFLDGKCNKIDKAITIKESQIEKLRKFRQITIHEAVTKGLDKQVNMKDSGFDWIGEIPEHWQVKKLKSFTNFINRGITPNYTETSEFHVINQATFSKGYFDLDNIKYTNINFNEFNRSRGRIQNDDLLIASTGGGVLGKVAIVKDLEGYYQADSHVTIVRCNTKYGSNNFYFYFFSINYNLINGVLAQGSTNQTELQRNWLLNFQLPVPPRCEQDQIVTHLENQTSQIDQAIELKEKQITQLKEYKQSLINEVVTGKVCVPQLTSMQ